MLHSAEETIFEDVVTEERCKDGSVRKWLRYYRH